MLIWSSDIEACLPPKVSPHLPHHQQTYPPLNPTSLFSNTERASFVPTTEARGWPIGGLRCNGSLTIER